MRKILSALVFAAISFVMVGCPQVVKPVPVIPTDSGYCESGCRHLATLKGRDGFPGCEESRVLELPDGDILTCTEFCKETQEKGRSLCPSRWMEAKECDDVEEVRLTCNPTKPE